MAANWINHGGDLNNRRYADGETVISPLTASRLRLKWRLNAGHDITATPAIFDGIFYFPSWNGNIYAVRAADGSLVWKKNLEELAGVKPLNSTSAIINVNATVSRATPTIADEKLIIAVYGPAYVIIVKCVTGQLVWKTQLDEHPSALVTMSGTYYNKAFYVGVSSLESANNIDNCCTFRGSFAKLDVRTGAVLWQTFMIPDNHNLRSGYAGEAVLIEQGLNSILKTKVLSRRIVHAYKTTQDTPLNRCGILNILPYCEPSHVLLVHDGLGRGSIGSEGARHRVECLL
ncbi:hypothetical protein ACS0TY_028979 [Phlomoides rotata]